MSLRAVLINPVQLVCPPFGLLQIAAVLEANGCEVEVKELPSPLVMDYQGHVARLISYMKENRPDIIGITCMASQRHEVKMIIAEIKNSGLSGKVIVGGVHASFMPEDVMGWGADYVVVYEGEDTIVELLKVIEGHSDASTVRGIYYLRNGVVKHTERRDVVADLDRLPLLAYHLVESARFTTRRSVIRGRWSRSGWVMTSRGCPSTCTFCSAHRMFGRKVRYRSIGHVLKEIDMLVRNYKIEAFALMDDTFTVNKDHVFEFCAEIKNRYPGMVWSCQARVNFFDEELAKVLRESNCIQVDFGVESGSQKVLDRLKKGIRVEEIIRSFDLCRKYGLRTVATIMVGNPGEEIGDLEKTKVLLARIKPDFSAAYYTTPFPGTELYEEAVGRGLIDGPDWKWHQHVESVSFSKVDPKIIKKYMRIFTKLNLIRNYLLNPLFLLDMARFSILNPIIAMRVGFNVIRGHSQRALFLIANSIYYKKQG